MRNKNFNYGKLQAKDEPVTVADFATRAIFGEKFSIAHLTKSSRMVMIDDNDYRTGFAKNFIAIDKGYAIAERLKQSYILFVDDKIIPCRLDYSDVPTCVVARTVDAAIDAVQRLGLPTKMYLDYNLRRETVVSFVDYLRIIFQERTFDYELHGFESPEQEFQLEALMLGFRRPTKKAA